MCFLCHFCRVNFIFRRVVLQQKMQNKSVYPKRYDWGTVVGFDTLFYSLAFVWECGEPFFVLKEKNASGVWISELYWTCAKQSRQDGNQIKHSTSQSLKTSQWQVLDSSFRYTSSHLKEFLIDNNNVFSMLYTSLTG